ncbi:MAG: bifunctional oligoribonuclease/PAP phosphatase NrnA [Chloroflexi bacterium]|nr:bifunctional oligoribonuclease/PAP phosphatase NrnA [Chloroflexota bacterium]
MTSVLEALQGSQSIVIVTHVQPDGDAIGTSLGLAHALRSIGKQVDVAVDHGVPDYLRFLPGWEQVQANLSAGEWDVLIAADSSDIERTGDCGRYARAHSKLEINLDHHATNTKFGDVQIVVPEAVSASEVAYDVLTASGVPIGPDSAKALLTGLVTDTIGFRTSNVSPRTLQIAQDLMKRGASLTEITALTLDTRSFDSLLVWREALAQLTLDDGVIYTIIPFDVFRRLRVDPALDLSLSSFLVKVDEAMISATFKELHDGRVELSLRSKLGFDVSRVAYQLGGGGHVQASGATIDGPLDAAVGRVLALLKDAVHGGKLIVR